MALTITTLTIAGTICKHHNNTQQQQQPQQQEKRAKILSSRKILANNVTNDVWSSSLRAQDSWKREVFSEVAHNDWGQSDWGRG